MFTGIVESLGKITNINVSQGNVDFTVKSSISKDLKIDQSVSHNGVCLTVVDLKNDTHTVTAVKETLDKSSLKNFNVGDHVNLERAMKLGERLPFVGNERAHILVHLETLLFFRTWWKRHHGGDSRGNWANLQERFVVVFFILFVNPGPPVEVISFDFLKHHLVTRKRRGTRAGFLSSCSVSSTWCSPNNICQFCMI